MAATTVSRNLDVEVRVQDYLNDKLQTTADLNNLETLLQNVQQQHELLRAQVRLISIPLKVCSLTKPSSRKPVASSPMPKVPPSSMIHSYRIKPNISTNNKQT